MTNLQKIKEAVWKANPDILSLYNFGCKVSKKGVIATVIYRPANPSTHIRVQFRSNKLSTLVKISELETLGRTIHLADILLAIKSTKLGPMVMIDCNGSFIGDNNVREQLITLGATWNLLEDDLDKNPQCWDFIAGLLDKN